MVKRRSRLWTVTLLTVLSGCNADLLNSDSGALDKFSHAYTNFRDSALEAEVGMHVISSDPDPVGYWKEMGSALDSKASDVARFRHASTAIVIYEDRFKKFVEMIGSDLNNMDAAVLGMVELANSLRTDSYRKNAAETAKAARDMHIAFTSMQDLSNKRLQLQLRLLRAIVDEKGRMLGLTIMSVGKKYKPVMSN